MCSSTGGRQRVIPPTLTVLGNSVQFPAFISVHFSFLLPYSSVQFSDSSLYNILHHPAELFPCIRLLVYGGCNWLGEHKQDTGHLYHSASACVTLDQLLLSVSMKKSETDHKQNTEHLSAPACAIPGSIAFESDSFKCGVCEKRFNAEERLVEHIVTGNLRRVQQYFSISVAF